MTLRPARGPRRDDAGFTLIEVMVAVLVLAIVSTGIVASMSTIITMTKDNRARITAANLAAQDLDLVRAIGDPYQVSDATSDTYVGTTTYHLTRTVSWVSSAGADVSCNSSTNLFYLRVNDRVTWDGMLPTTAAVQDDTLLAPSDATSNSETGAIEISVDDQSGAAVAGVNVVITPATGPALAPGPSPTTADGCTYANQLLPGNYTVQITKNGYVGLNPSSGTQSASPSQTVQVTAGSTASANFTYQLAATYSTPYVTWPLAYSASTVNLPSNLPTNFLSTGPPDTALAPASVQQLYPYPSGYTVTAGPAGANASSCSSIDPAAWPAGTVNGVALRAGVRGASNPTAGSGGSGTIKVPVGVVTVHAPAGAVLRATQAVATGAGNPGCTVTGSVLNWSVTGNGGWVALALPYGSWTITAGGSALSPADLVVQTNAAPGGVSAGGVVTLDPRKAS